MLSDRQGSVTSEMDDQGRVTVREEYYPYGGSAGSDEEVSEITDRTRRYSGKERDATGLMYYGYRYYQLTLYRWLSADPGGVIDGVNLYRMVRNNPVTLRDTDGLKPVDNTEQAVINDGYNIVAKGLNLFPPDYQKTLNNAVNIASTLLSTAQSAMENEENKDKTMKSVSAYFGNIDNKQKGTLLEKLEKFNDILDDLKDKNYILIDGGEKGYKNVSAFVFPADTQKRIFIHKHSFSEKSYVTIAMTIIHEISHFTGTKDFPVSAEDPRTAPELYFPPPPVNQNLEGFIETLQEHSENKLVKNKKPEDLLNNADSLAAFVFDLAITTDSQITEIIDELHTS